MGQGERMAREWRDWEAEHTMAGIQCPCLEVVEPRAVAATGVEDAEGVEPPVLGCGAREARESGREGAKKKRRRWRPLNVATNADEPQVEMEDAVGEVRKEDSQVGERQEAEQVAAPPPEQPRRTSEVRPRGKRQRGAPPQAFVVELVTFNGSGAPQLLDAMEVLGAKRNSLAALLVQEHHGKGDSLADLQAGARTRGMKVAPSEATTGAGGGRSAGVGVAVPSHRGWGGVFSACWDLSPKESPGRLAGAWLQAGPRGGHGRPLHLLLALGGDVVAERGPCEQSARDCIRLRLRMDHRR